MASEHYPGNEALARTLLSIGGEHRMLAGEIIATLAKSKLSSPAPERVQARHAPLPEGVDPFKVEAFGLSRSRMNGYTRPARDWPDICSERSEVEWLRLLSVS